MIIIKLLYFILGMCFVQFVLPIGDSFVSLVCTFFEYLKGKLGVIIAKNNSIIQQTTSEQPPTVSHVIGFEVPTETEEIEEWEDDENE